MEDIVVTSRAGEARTSIDSISYSLAGDLQASTGVLADVLRNLPSVEVDAEGNVSLRGDPGVTILVDGRPAAQFNSAGRGSMVLSTPASQYARVEVMTNPSAAFSPEGSGGVINLISKPAPVRPGATTNGSARASLGDQGRHSLGVNVAHVSGDTTVTLDAGLRRERHQQEVERYRRSVDPTSGQTTETRQRVFDAGPSDITTLGFTVDHKLSAKTSLFGELRHARIENRAEGVNIFEASDGGGEVISAYARAADRAFANRFANGVVRLLRRFDGDGHEWSNEIRFSGGESSLAHAFLVDQQVPAAAPFSETVRTSTDQEQLAFTSAYVRPLRDNGRLRLGYELQAVNLTLDNRVARGASPDALDPDPRVSNRFQVDQTVHALYTTYERPLGGKLSAQVGLRLEQARLDLNQVTTGIRSSNDYLRAYPTLHLAYELTDTDTVRGSYSRRIQRPGPADLNPFIIYQDPLNYRSGNPDLLPQETDAFELMWQRRAQSTSYQATAYYRDTRDAFTQVTADLGGGAFLTRPENLGSHRAIGVEVTASGALHPTLRYNASLNLARQKIDASSLTGGLDSEGESISGRMSLNWQPTAQDFAQLSYALSGDQLLAQGTRKSAEVINLGYRRRLTNDWFLQVTARHAFIKPGFSTAIRTPGFSEDSRSTFGGQAVFVGFVWNFGSGQRRAEQFDFNAAPAGN